VHCPARSILKKDRTRASGKGEEKDRAHHWVVSLFAIEKRKEYQGIKKRQERMYEKEKIAKWEFDRSERVLEKKRSHEEGRDKVSKKKKRIEKSMLPRVGKKEG